jgi:hypothetical protein
MRAANCTPNGSSPAADQTSRTISGRGPKWNKPNLNNWLFLALAEHRLGHEDAAKAAAAKARAALAGFKPDNVWDRAETELLAAELDVALPASK